MRTLIKNAQLTNAGKTSKHDVLIEGKFITGVFEPGKFKEAVNKIIDAEGLWLIPGIIDDQVHFREPGLTCKADIYTESRAAAAGGVTSFMDMPNTNPPTLTNELLEEKHKLAEKKSLINYSFYLGASNDNIEEIKNVDKSRVPGIKLFLGSSTGNMLINDTEVIESIFKNSPVLCAVHCESDDIINKNLETAKKEFGNDIPFRMHPVIRSREACYDSSSKAIALAKKHNTTLHVLHLSTKEELELLTSEPLQNKKITGEVCVHHLWFNDIFYDKLGSKIKWNPAIKSEADRLALLEALKTGKLDVVATDHAPHTSEEKKSGYLNCPSGGPLIQHSLKLMIELMKQNYFTKEELVKFMCHNPADLFGINKRGYIEPSYYADLVLIDLNKKSKVTKDNLLYKCGWSPLEGYEFSSEIVSCFVNGNVVYNKGEIFNDYSGMPLEYSGI